MWCMIHIIGVYNARLTGSSDVIMNQDALGLAQLNQFVVLQWLKETQE